MPGWEGAVLVFSLAFVHPCWPRLMVAEENALSPWPAGGGKMRAQQGPHRF